MIKNYIYTSKKFYSAMDFIFYLRDNIDKVKLIECDNMKMGEFSYIIDDSEIYGLRCNITIGDKNILCYCLDN